MNRKLIIGTAVVIAALTVLALLLIRPEKQPGETGITISPSPTSTFNANPHRESEAVHQAERQENPVLRELPENNRHWSLTFNGSAGNRYKLRAVVYYTPDQDPSRKIAQQKRFIIGYLDRIGQPRGTYVVKYEAKKIDAEGY